MEALKDKGTTLHRSIPWSGSLNSILRHFYSGVVVRVDSKAPLELTEKSLLQISLQKNMAHSKIKKNHPLTYNWLLLKSATHIKK